MLRLAPSGRALALAILLAALTATAVLFGGRLTYDVDIDAYIHADPTEPERYGSTLDHLGETFGYEDSLTLIVLEAEDEARVLAPAALTWLRRTAALTAELEDVGGVYSLATLAALWSGPPQRTTTVSDGEAASFAQSLEREKLVDGLLVNRARTRATTIVGLREATRGFGRMLPAMRTLRDAVATEPVPDGYRLRWAGFPVLRERVVHDVKDEQRSQFPLVALASVVGLWIVLGSLACALLVIVGVYLGVLWTSGLLGALSGRWDLLDSLVPVGLLAFGVAVGVRIVHRYAEALVATPDDRAGAARTALRGTGRACLWAGVALTLVFLAPVTARHAALRNIGWHLAAGAVLVTASVWLVCALTLSRCRPRIPESDTAGRLARLREISARHPRAVAGGLLVLLAVLGWSATRIPVRTHVLEMYDVEHPVRSTMRVVERDLGGLLTVDVVLAADSADVLLDPKVAAKIDGVTRWAAAQPEVALVHSHVSLQGVVLRRLFQQDTPVAQWTAPQIKTADMSARAFHETLRYHRFLTREGTEARIMMRVPDLPSDELEAFSARLHAQVAQAQFNDAGVRAHLTGMGHIHADALPDFHRDLRTGLFGALALAVLLTMVVFRSWRLGVLALVPVVTPLLLVLGVMSLGGETFTRACVVALLLAVGLGAQATMHLLARFVRARAETGDPVRRTLRSTARATVGGALVVLAGLFPLHGSQLVPTDQLARLLGVALVGTMIAQTLLLPALLACMPSGRRAA